MIGICTDSGSQLPQSFATRLGIEVVPLTVTVGEQEFLEGVDLDVDQLYALLGDEAAPATVGQPSPGQCAVAYETLAERGCSSIISVHSSLAECNALHAARLATRTAPVPVRIVDCASISFGVGCCAWAAAAAVGHSVDQSVDEVVEMIDGLVPRIAHVFASGAEDRSDARVNVASGIDEVSNVVTCAPSSAAAVDAMCAHVLADPGPLRIGVGAGAADALPLADELERALHAAGRDVELVRYRIGAGAAQRLRPATVGCFAFPAG